MTNFLIGYLVETNSFFMTPRVHLSLDALFALSQSSTIRSSWMPFGTAGSMGLPTRTYVSQFLLIGHK